MKRLIALAVVAVLTFAIFYVSRFWFLSLWGREGLFGWDELRPQGNLVATWLRGTEAAPFELLIWAVGVFLVLTWVQKLFNFFFRPPDH